MNRIGDAGPVRRRGTDRSSHSAGDDDVFVLLDDSLRPDGRCRLFRRPERIVRCHRADAVDAALAAIEDGLAAGLTAAGYFAYELGYLLEPRLLSLLPRRGRYRPLLWIGLFEAAETLSAVAVRDWLERHRVGDCRLSPLRPAVDRDTYRSRFERVRAWIDSGDVYQVNLTFPCLFRWRGDPIALYARLRREQRVAHGALIAAGDHHVLSLSPELFVAVEGGVARARPMKGTAARGPTGADDARRRADLARDPKVRAENLMIVDLLRNDLGRIARVGSVAVTDLFTAETYPTLHQLTSGITARLRERVGLRELLRTLFPCGSVTGAPKIRAMEIIRAVETTPRGVYTGAIGAIEPSFDLALNVAIRTLLLWPDGSGDLGVGSGVVADSTADGEYDESLLKARFVVRRTPPFALIETLRWDPGSGYVLLERHLARLGASAGYFGFRCDLDAVRARLAAEAATFDAVPRRVRLLLDEDGRPTLSAAPLATAAAGAVLRFALADRRVSSLDPFRHHKTTRRALLDSTLVRLRATTGCDEVLFLNERGELTEGSWTTLFVERGGRLRTPPLASGLLDGTLRRELLETQPERVVEAVLYPRDLAAADRVWLGNSVRGLMPAVAAGPTAANPPAAAGTPARD